MFTDIQLQFISTVAEKYGLGDLMVDDEGVSIGDTFYITGTTQAVSYRTLLGEFWHTGFTASIVYVTHNDEYGMDCDEIEIACDSSLVGVMKQCILHLKEMELHTEMWGMFNEIDKSTLIHDTFYPEEADRIEAEMESEEINAINARLEEYDRACEPLV